EIVALSEVRTISPAPRVGTRLGAATNQADDTSRAVNVRTFLNYDGSEVSVGILSDSFNDSRGGTVSAGSCACATPGSTCTTVVDGMTDQVSGDLPVSIPILDDCTTPSFCSSLSDEGAAIGELMFDLVPGAGFMFHSAFNSPADFAGGITELVHCGADLIVDDVFWTQQPFFQDGIIAQAAQDATDGGVPYFSAAGNDATFGVDDSYVDSVPAIDDSCAGLPNGDDLHDFDGGDRFAGITLPDGCSLYAELQWADPFDAPLGPGAATDLDLFLLSTATAPARTGGANILDSSTTSQGCGIPQASFGDPVEFVEHTNASGDPETVFLAVEHCCGDEGIELRIVTLSFDCGTTGAGWDFEDGEAGESTIFVDPQIFGHPAARDVVAVAATFFGEIDSGGAQDPPAGQLDVEPFSSLGGDLPFYFDDDGDPLPMAPQLRFKPEVTGPDGGNTTFFGGDITFDPDTDPNFFGTSASAPNVAAVAALILDATGENITPPALAQLLEQATLDMETAGPDDLSGFGFVDALNAARSVDDNSAPLIDELVFDLDGRTFLGTPSSSLQPLQAISKLTLGDGDYTGLEGLADELIFVDGFESGDTSAWGN
ncbi:MAG: S8 family serine peptidase, partial [Thermoanaerobaculia bacterium]